jgi:hypothetical protein
MVAALIERNDMKLIAALIAAATISACAPTADTKGQIVELTDRTVTIRGFYDMSPSAMLAGKTAAPTPAMIAQAQEACPGAKYLSASSQGSNGYTFDYLFQCR